MVTKKAGNAGTATVKGYGTGDIHPNVSGSKGSNWNGGNNKRGCYNSVNKGNKGWNKRSHSGNWNRGSVSHWNHQKKQEFVAANNKYFIVDKQGHNGKESVDSRKKEEKVEKEKDFKVKKQGRKERRHKEAQDVLAAATTAAAASSRLSSFRKDTLEESAHHELVDSHFGVKVRAHSESGRAVRFINEGLVILTGSPDCSILAIDIETGSPNCYFALRNNCHKRINLPYTGDKYLLHKQSTKWITVMTIAPPRLEKGAGVLDKPVIEKTTLGRESEFDLRKSRKVAPPYRVMLHNDNYNKREYVVQVLMKVIPGMTVDNAVNIMLLTWTPL
uniref:Adaptor protein ClpS core domain-containing protein n=1 Tax=Lactuca sativa TaxID=4236 RepID=A0A9R1VRV5_LACSA|nr:hypothetical protein LSAT_V11C400205290 [Lactuca sativa]